MIPDLKYVINHFPGPSCLITNKDTTSHACTVTEIFGGSVSTAWVIGWRGRCGEFDCSYVEKKKRSLCRLNTSTLW